MSFKKEKICFLLGLWGRNYIDLFFQYSLPSLLAEGNIPQLSQNFSLSFTFLTKQSDVKHFEDSKSIHVLKEYCTVDYENIDDLICDGSYSTTLTLAYDRGMKVHGYEMLNTYFIFLTSDYIMADGSLMGLAKYISQGYSGICTGNYQVKANSFRKYLNKKFNSEKTVLCVSKREMVQESFKHLHSWSLSSLIDQNLVCNYKANRFFSFINEQVLVGRFYLLHMLCIKPETLDYKIGSSCDYSFIPSMCPSGNVVIINDSDDYFVLEMQDEQNEDGYKIYQAVNKNKMAISLSGWVTDVHKNNSQYPIYFHSNDIKIKDLAEQSQFLTDYIHQLNCIMENKKSKSPYNHFYWKGALKSLDQHRKKKSAYAYNDSMFSFTNMMRKFYKEFMSDKHFFCLRWKETNAIKKIIKKSIKQRQDKICIHYSPSDFLNSNLCNWLKTLPNEVSFVETNSNNKSIEEMSEDLSIFFCETLHGFKSNLEKLSKNNVLNSGKNILFFIQNKYFQSEFKNKVINTYLCTDYGLLKDLKTQNIKNNNRAIGDIFEKYFIQPFNYHLILRRFMTVISLLIIGIFNLIFNLIYLLPIKNRILGTTVIAVIVGKYNKRNILDAS